MTLQLQPGNVYKIEEEGMPVRGNTHIHGALFVTFHVDFPDQIDPNFVYSFDFYKDQ